MTEIIEQVSNRFISYFDNDDAGGHDENDYSLFIEKAEYYANNINDVLELIEDYLDYNNTLVYKENGQYIVLKPDDIDINILNQIGMDNMWVVKVNWRK